MVQTGDRPRYAHGSAQSPQLDKDASLSGGSDYDSTNFLCPYSYSASISPVPHFVHAENPTLACFVSLDSRSLLCVLLMCIMYHGSDLKIWVFLFRVQLGFTGVRVRSMVVSG